MSQEQVLPTIGVTHPNTPAPEAQANPKPTVTVEPPGTPIPVVKPK